MKVLVAYATRHGATRGIAEHIAKTLEHDGLTVDLRPADEVDAIERYDAYVIGSSAYAFHWIKEATELVRRNRAVLAERPTWLFTSGPLGTDEVDEKGRDVREAARPREFAEFESQIKPRGMAVFFGAYNPDDAPAGIAEQFMKGFMKVVPSLRSALPIGDFRDWPAIEEWAHKVAHEIKLGSRVEEPVLATTR